MNTNFMYVFFSWFQRERNYGSTVVSGVGSAVFMNSKERGSDELWHSEYLLFEGCGRKNFTT
jgi:hypothetical protein